MDIFLAPPTPVVLPAWTAAAERVSTCAEFTAWLRAARTGSVIEYHRGFLVIDRDPRHSGLAQEARRACDLLADDVYVAAGKQNVSLVQRRVADGLFAYLAVSCGARLRRAALE